MKKPLTSTGSRTTLLLLSLVILSCSKNEEPAPAPTITDFSPDYGTFGTVVTITGANFDTDKNSGVKSTSWPYFPQANKNEISFNGIRATIIGLNTATSITTTVPPGVTSGPISVTVNEKTAASATNFTVLTGSELDSRNRLSLIGSWKETSLKETSCTNSNDNNHIDCTIDCATITFDAATVTITYSVGTPVVIAYSLDKSTLTVTMLNGVTSTSSVYKLMMDNPISTIYITANVLTDVRLNATSGCTQTSTYTKI